MHRGATPEPAATHHRVGRPRWCDRLGCRSFATAMSGRPGAELDPGTRHAVTLGLAIAYILSAIFRFPLIGVLLGPMLKENLSWRTRRPRPVPCLHPLHLGVGADSARQVGGAVPALLVGDATRLGWVKVALGIPPFLLCVYLTWIFLRQGPAADRRDRGDGGRGEGRAGAEVPGRQGRQGRRSAALGVDRPRSCPRPVPNRPTGSRPGTEATRTAARTPAGGVRAAGCARSVRPSPWRPGAGRTAAARAAPRAPVPRRTAARPRPPAHRPCSGSVRGCRG
ncbi:hypothetical protein SANTM175S_05262 [Streptomyces antimycoticus]